MSRWFYAVMYLLFEANAARRDARVRFLNAHYYAAATEDQMEKVRQASSEALRGAETEQSDPKVTHLGTSETPSRKRKNAKT